MIDVLNKTVPEQRPVNQPQDGSGPLPGMVEVNVTTAAELDQHLEDAIAVVTKTAAHHGMGVLVTRTGVGTYIIRAHPAVPYGLIRQQHKQHP